MPRGPRLDAPNSLHHVTARGIERRDLFADDQDRRELVAILSLALPAGELECPAWSFMSNHLHLVLRTGSRPLSKGIHRALSKYARYFNRRHGRSGYLFQNRFHSSLIQDESYLLTAIRYVLRNPIVGGVVADLDELARFEWTAYPALIGRAAAGFTAVDFTSSLLGQTKPHARRALQDLLSTPEECEGLSESRLAVVGDEAFQRRVLLERRRVDDRRLEALIDSVCTRLAVDRKALEAGRRGPANSAARAAIAYLANGRGVSMRELGPWLGVGRSSLSRSLPRGAQVVREEGLIDS